MVGMSCFSHGGLLSDKLLRLSKWIEADSQIEAAWNNLELARKERAAAHFFMRRMSNLFEIFQR